MAEGDARPLVIGPGEGPTVRNPAGAPLTYMARSGQTGGAMTVFETGAAPGEGPPLHLHPNAHEVLYVLDGRLRISVDGEVHEAPPGTFVFIPKGVPHAWRNAADHPARFLVVFTPAAPGMERFFERSAELPAGTGPADAFRRFGDDAGMEVVGPPLPR